jgi:hypothetical protein
MRNDYSIGMGHIVSLGAEIIYPVLKGMNFEMPAEREDMID